VAVELSRGSGCDAEPLEEVEPAKLMRIRLDLIGAGRLDLGWMVTHRYRIDEIDGAFGDLEAKPAGFVKGVVFPAAGT
jgi:threonine dehydrogenase-like Zn-dependent dehydrogenase